MSESQLLLLQDAQAFVTDLLSNKLSKSIKFHSLQHTQEVVAACQMLADNQQLPEEDRIPLLLAAWFHDTGYTSGEVDTRKLSKGAYILTITSGDYKQQFVRKFVKE